MSTTQPRLPGPDHPITIQPATVRVVVSAGEHVIADSTDALVLQEASYPPVYYLPLADLDQAALRDSETTSWCPYKGTASYYSVDAGDGLLKDVIWFYPDAHEAVAEISGHAAFYPDRVTITTSALSLPEPHRR